jgi:hypothetical protein
MHLYNSHEINSNLRKHVLLKQDNEYGEICKNMHVKDGYDVGHRYVRDN